LVSCVAILPCLRDRKLLTEPDQHIFKSHSPKLKLGESANDAILLKFQLYVEKALDVVFDGLVSHLPKNLSLTHSFRYRKLLAKLIVVNNDGGRGVLTNRLAATTWHVVSESPIFA
jgi:hypothetical protein